MNRSLFGEYGQCVFIDFLGITLKGRYVAWLAIARPSGLPPYGRHHSTALMHQDYYLRSDLINQGTINRFAGSFRFVRNFLSGPGRNVSMESK